MGFVKVYLVAYNVLQCVGWTILMWRLLPHLTLAQLQAPTAALYQSVGGLLRCVQTAAFLEVVHAATGIYYLMMSVFSVELICSKNQIFC